MKIVITLFLIASAITIENVFCSMQCELEPVEIPKDWITMTDPCIKKMKRQVQEELKAAVTYLAMGAHFSKDIINRPGFAKFFFDNACEEREHAIKIISYLLMRGELRNNLKIIINDPRPLKEYWESGLDALKDAISLEAHVTRSINDIITTCEKPSLDGLELLTDYNLVNYLSEDFLTEQYKGQRDLAGKISVLGKMIDTSGPLGEFLFDKKLLNGEPL